MRTGLLAFEPLPANHDADKLQGIFQVLSSSVDPFSRFQDIKTRIGALEPLAMAALGAKNYFITDGGGNFKNAIVQEGYSWRWYL
jgi:hypothetical protein